MNIALLAITIFAMPSFTLQSLAFNGKEIPNSRVRLTFVILALVCYSIAVIELFGVIGPIVAAFAVVPAVVGGVLYGPWRGLLLGYACAPITWFAFLMIGSNEAIENIATMQSYIGHSFVAAIGYGTGYVARLNRKLKHEIQERIQAQEALNEANQLLAHQANKAAGARNHFLTAVSHKLRTPMNAAHGMTSLLLHSELDAQQRQYAKDALQGNQDTVNAINAILDYTKAESGALEIEAEELNLVALIKRVVEAYENRLTGKICFHYDVLPNVPASCLVDPRRVSTVLRNVLNNSVSAIQSKQIDDGEIEIIVRSKPVAEAPISTGPSALASQLTIIEISIADNGIGIEPQSLESIFEPFGNAQNMATGLNSDSGLGLPLCRALCQVMGGDIEIKSVPDSGTTLDFSFIVENIPVENLAAANRLEEPRLSEQRVSEPRLSGIPSSGTDASHRCITDHDAGEQMEKKLDESFARQRPLSILLAEDNFVNAKVAEKMLGKLGYQIDWVKDGQQAIDAYKDNEYDVILMDIQMPNVNGLEATESIRTSTDIREQPYIIAVTADTTLEEKAKRVDCGLNAYIGKPIIFDTLQNELSVAWANCHSVQPITQ